MFDDVKNYVRKYPQCQMFAPASNRPSSDLHTLRSLWPFMRWGLDVARPLPRAQPQLRFLLLTTDYFTKWIEAISLSEVSGQQIVKFLWQNIVCRFGIPHTIISDNGTNFASKQVASFCAKYNIAHRFFSPYYPQGNGQAEISNHTILDNLCKSLDKAKGKWAGKTLWSTMGLHDQQTRSDRRNPILVSIRDGGYHPG